MVKKDHILNKLREKLDIQISENSNAQEKIEQLRKKIKIYAKELAGKQPVVDILRDYEPVQENTNNVKQTFTQPEKQSDGPLDNNLLAELANLANTISNVKK